jgi:hypothetical protein
MRHSTPHTIPALILAAVFGFAISGTAQNETIIFGSNDDGNGGFTPSAETGTESWTLGTDSYNYTFGSTSNPTASGDGPNDEGNTASLLKQYTLDRSVGSSYTFEGVVDLADGYGDDNNRIGMLLFNDTSTQTSDGGGGMYFVLNTDNNDHVGIRSGINGGDLDIGNHSVSPGDDWIGDTLTYTASIEFTNNGVDDEIDVSFDLVGATNGSLGTFTTTVLATDYTGTYFGFASKWRSRNTLDSERNAVANFDYQSFSVIPEPSSIALFLVAIGAGIIGLKRRRS